MNIFSKTNRDIAAVAAKVMAEQPAKVEEYKPKPLDNSLVDQVVASGLQTRFDITKKHLKEESKKVLHNASTDDPTTKQHDESQKAKLDHTPKWPKPHKPIEKTTGPSPGDGSMKEDWHEGLQSDYAAKMRKPVYEKEKEEPPFEGGHKVPKKHTDKFGLAKHLAKKGLASVLAKRKKGK